MFKDYHNCYQRQQYQQYLIKSLLSFFIASAIFLFSPKEVLAQVVMNEFQLSPSSDQWIELYNNGDSDIDISGWIIDDSSGGSSKLFSIPSGTVLVSKKCISFESGNFDWNTSTSDSVRLISPSSTEEYPYTKSPGDNISIGRVVDGEGNLAVLTSQSRDEYNVNGESCLAPTPTPSPTPTEEPEEAPEPTSTPEPTNTPTPKPTPTPTKKPTPTLKPSPTSTPSGEILGEEESATNAFYPLEATEEGEATPEAGLSFKTRWLPKIFLGVGFLLLFGAAFWVWYTKLRWPEQESS